MGRSKYGPTWPKFADMTVSVLVEVPGEDRVELPIAPTAKSIRYKGERFFRMEDTRAHVAGGFGGIYLWDGWMADVIQRGRAMRELADRV